MRYDVNEFLPDAKIVTVMRLYDVSQAEMAVSMLETEGVRCGLVGANLYNVNYFYGLASGGIKLEVRQEDVPKAVEILRRAFDEGQSEMVELPPAATAIVDEEAEKCPKCGSGDISFEKYARRPFFLGILLFGFPLPFRKNIYQCCKCGHCWQ